MRLPLGDEDWIVGPGEITNFDTAVTHWFGPHRRCARRDTQHLRPTR
jgi:hypothetical protein